MGYIYIEKQLKASLSTLNNNIYIVCQLRFYNEVRKSFDFGKWTFLKCPKMKIRKKS